MPPNCSSHIELSGVPCICPPMPQGLHSPRLPVMTVNDNPPDVNGNVKVTIPEVVSPSPEGAGKAADAAAVYDALGRKQDSLTDEQMSAVNSGVTKEAMEKLATVDKGAQKNPDLSDYAKKSDIPKVPYLLVKKTLIERVELDNRAINEVTVDDSVAFITFVFPEKTEGYSRDFFLRLVITGETIPTLSFVEPNGDAVSFDVDDESWAEIDQGVNILMFTDTAE